MCHKPNIKHPRRYIGASTLYRTTSPSPTSHSASRPFPGEPGHSGLTDRLCNHTPPTSEPPHHLPHHHHVIHPCTPRLSKPIRIGILRHPRLLLLLPLRRRRRSSRITRRRLPPTHHPPLIRINLGTALGRPGVHRRTCGIRVVDGRRCHVVHAVGGGSVAVDVGVVGGWGGGVGPVVAGVGLGELGAGDEELLVLGRLFWVGGGWGGGGRTRW